MNLQMIGPIIISILLSIIATLGYTTHKASKLSLKNKMIIESFKERIAALEDKISEAEECSKGLRNMLIQHNK